MMELTKPFAVAILMTMVHAAKLIPLEGSKLVEKSNGRRLIPVNDEGNTGQLNDIGITIPPSIE